MKLLHNVHLKILVVFLLTAWLFSISWALRIEGTETDSVATLDGGTPRISPKSPREDLKTIRTQSGFRVELVDTEPLIRDRVAIDFDVQGWMYVVDAPEYNQYAARQQFDGQGAVKRLVDTDGDGTYDRATMYVDNWIYPSFTREKPTFLQKLGTYGG